MTAAALSLQEQRSAGHVALRVGARGLERMREAGAAKARFPQGGHDAILINTGGGLAGGDDFRFDIEAGPGARLAVTTQAAERVYRTLGPPASVRTSLKVEDGATLQWLPQESILFDGASLHRKLEADLAERSSFLGIESVIFGRAEMGERIGRIALRDRWRIRRDGRLVFADDIAIDGAMPVSKATFHGAGAMAVIVYAAPDAEARVDAVRHAIGEAGAASAWDGKLVARILAGDGFGLRKSVIPALLALAGFGGLPRAWSF
jgi:urease accessory protein